MPSGSIRKNIKNASDCPIKYAVYGTLNTDSRAGTGEDLAAVMSPPPALAMGATVEHIHMGSRTVCIRTFLNIHITHILVQRANNEYDLVKYSSVKSSYKTQERRVERRVSSYHSVECFFNSCS